MDFSDSFTRIENIVFIVILPLQQEFDTTLVIKLDPQNW